MKRILLCMVIGILVYVYGMSYADDADTLCCLENGFMPNDIQYHDMRSTYRYKVDPMNELPEGWEIIDGVLYDMNTKTLVVIPDETDCGEILSVAPGTQYICRGALTLNDTIKEIYLPDGVKVIGQESLTGYAFAADEVAIEKIHVPASVRLIQEPLAKSKYSEGCGKPLFMVDENNPRYISTPDGLLIDKLEGTVIWCALFPEKRVVTVPDGIRRIAPYAFAGCDEIISVELPDSLIEIGEGAFSMMFGLKELTIPENVLRIGPRNFDAVGDSWVYDENNEMIDKEALEMFGINRSPGIHFLGTEFLFEMDCEIDDYGEPWYIFRGFDTCNLPVECPAGAKSLEILENYYGSYGGMRLTVVEPDGTSRIVEN